MGGCLAGRSRWRGQVLGDPATFRAAAADVATAAVEFGVPAGRHPALHLAVHELLVNAWEHGHRGTREPPIHVEVTRGDDGAVTVRVLDAAVGGRWDPDVPAAPADADRGRGLAIVRRVVDEMTVDATEHHTVVTLTTRGGGANG